MAQQVTKAHVARVAVRMAEAINALSVLLDEDDSGIGSGEWFCEGFPFAESLEDVAWSAMEWAARLAATAGQDGGQ
jgi:hypothetical protein